MKHYKDPSTNEVYAYEADGSQDAFIKEGLIAITNQEADAIREANAKAQFASQSYAEKRAGEYPPITDYLDAIVKGDHELINKYIADCKAVKAKYPKGAK